jgi:hypothetical protein
MFFIATTTPQKYILSKGGVSQQHIDEKENRKSSEYLFQKASLCILGSGSGGGGSLCSTL